MSDQFLMKGRVFSEHAHKLVYPVWAEVKYDEIRVHVHLSTDEEYAEHLGNQPRVQFLSYAGKPLYNLHPWAKKFEEYMQASGYTDLDMGVQVNGNFNDSYRWCRSKNGFPKAKLDKATGQVAPALGVDMVSFYLFDLPNLVGMPFHERAMHRSDSVAAMWDTGIPALFPAGEVVRTPEKLDALFFEMRAMGCEGLMVKTPDHTYQCGKRIDGWLKMKPEETFDGAITKINRAVSIEGVPLDRAGSVDVLLEDGSTASPAGIPHELGRWMLANPTDYIDQWCEFKAMERDRKGGYRHPSFVRLREAKA